MSFQRNINLLGSPCSVAIKSVAGNQILTDFTKIYGKPSKIRVSVAPRLSKAGILFTKKVILEYPGISYTDFTKFFELMHDRFELLVTYSSGEVFQFSGVNAPMSLAAPYTNKGTKLSFETKDVRPIQFLNGTITTQDGDSTLTIIGAINTPQLITITQLDNYKVPGVYYFNTPALTINTVTYSVYPSATQLPLKTMSPSFNLQGAILEVYGAHTDTNNGYDHVTQKLTSGYTGEIFYRQYNSDQDGWHNWYSVRDTLKYIEVTASRNFLNSDKGCVLIIKNSNVVLTLDEHIELDADFNCCIKPLTGYNAKITPYVGAPVGFVDAPNGLEIEENKMVSVGRLGLTYIVSP